MQKTLWVIPKTVEKLEFGCVGPAANFLFFARALYSYNGLILQKKKRRSRVAKFQLFNRFWYSFIAIFIFQGMLVADSIDGFWKNVNEKTGLPGIIVSIYEHEGKHFGRIIGAYDSNGALDDSIYAASSRAKGVEGNPFYSGLDFIWNLIKKGSRYKGKIMDPRKGKTYDVELWTQGDKLIVRGEILCFGSNQIWHPASENDFSDSFQKPDVKQFIPVIPEAKK